MSILFYKRPEYISKGDGPMSNSNCQKYVKKAACTRSSIPPNLSFENVMEGRTMPPCSLQDFMDYLVYIAHDAENLQFYLWLQDYTKRFDALAKAEKELSPAWKWEDSAPDLVSNLAPKKSNTSSPVLDKDIETFDNEAFDNPLQRTHTPRKPSTIAAVLGKAQSGSKYQTFTSQPFRAEISQIATHYLTPESPRELNLSHRTRSSILHALSQTTHPSAFAQVLSLTTLTLRNQSHPNFVRWSLCNGNQPRVLFLRTFACFWLSVAVCLAIILTLSHQSRWIRIVVAPILWFGITNLVAASKGLCVLLHRLHTREVHPWEILDEKEKLTTHLTNSPAPNPISQAPHTSVLPLNLKPPSVYSSAETLDLEACSDSVSSHDSERYSPFGPPNSYQHENWVDRWRSQAWWRKLHVRKVWVREEGLRLMQNRIVIQAELWALMITLPVVTAIVACPPGNFY